MNAKKEIISNKNIKYNWFLEGGVGNPAQCAVGMPDFPHEI